ncbi:hypothetical protein Tco_1337548 [Tanacetum coccineum]
MDIEVCTHYVSRGMSATRDLSLCHRRQVDIEGELKRLDIREHACNNPTDIWNSNILAGILELMMVRRVLECVLLMYECDNVVIGVWRQRGRMIGRVAMPETSSCLGSLAREMSWLKTVSMTAGGVCTIHASATHVGGWGDEELNVGDVGVLALGGAGARELQWCSEGGGLFRVDYLIKAQHLREARSGGLIWGGTVGYLVMALQISEASGRGGSVTEDARGLGRQYRKDAGNYGKWSAYISFERYREQAESRGQEIAIRGLGSAGNDSVTGGHTGRTGIPECGLWCILREMRVSSLIVRMVEYSIVTVSDNGGLTHESAKAGVYHSDMVIRINEVTTSARRGLGAVRWMDVVTERRNCGSEGFGEVRGDRYLCREEAHYKKRRRDVEQDNLLEIQHGIYLGGEEYFLDSEHIGVNGRVDIGLVAVWMGLYHTFGRFRMGNILPEIETQTARLILVLDTVHSICENTVEDMRNPSSHGYRYIFNLRVAGFLGGGRASRVISARRMSFLDHRDKRCLPILAGCGGVPFIFTGAVGAKRGRSWLWYVYDSYYLWIGGSILCDDVTAGTSSASRVESLAYLLRALMRWGVWRAQNRDEVVDPLHLPQHRKPASTIIYSDLCKISIRRRRDTLMCPTLYEALALAQDLCVRSTSTGHNTYARTEGSLILACFLAAMRDMTSSDLSQHDLRNTGVRRRLHGDSARADAVFAKELRSYEHFSLYMNIRASTIQI